MRSSRLIFKTLGFFLLSAQAAHVWATGPDFSEAEWDEAAPENISQSSRLSYTYVVIHLIEGSLQTGINTFNNPAEGVSAHYLVGNSGRIVQMVHEADVARHAGNLDINRRSIGIEHEGQEATFQSSRNLFQASAKIVRHLLTQYSGIQADRNHIIGHIEVPDPDNSPSCPSLKPSSAPPTGCLYGGDSHHTDPGSNWDWTRYMAFVQDNIQSNLKLKNSSNQEFTGTTNDTTVAVEGNDGSTGTGIDLISLNSIPPGSYSSTQTFSGQSELIGNQIESKTFTNLSEGQYVALVRDLAGNDTSVTFIIDTTQPGNLVPRDSAGNLIGGATTFDNKVLFSLTDNACLDRVKLSGDHFNQERLASGATYFSSYFDNITPDQDYVTTMQDCAGNKAFYNLTVYPRARDVLAITSTLTFTGNRELSKAEIGPFYVRGSTWLAISFDGSVHKGTYPPEAYAPGMNLSCYVWNPGISVGIYRSSAETGPYQFWGPPLFNTVPWDVRSNCDGDALLVDIATGASSSCHDDRLVNYNFDAFGVKYVKIEIAKSDGACKVYPNGPNYDQRLTDLRGIGSFWASTVDASIPTIIVGGNVTAPQPATGFTPAGSSVALSSGSVLAQFAQVLINGITQFIHKVIPPTVASISKFLTIGSNSVEVVTTATYSGSIQVTIKYDPSEVPSQKEASLQLVKISTNGTVENITTAIDLVNKKITGTTTSLGTFAVGVPNDAPQAVTNLASASVSSTTIALAWTAPQDDGTQGAVQRYELRFSTLSISSSSFTGAQLASQALTPKTYGSTEAFTVTGLAPLTTYYFAIRSFDFFGATSAISNLVSTQTLIATPAAPTNFTGTALSTTAILWSWTDAANNEDGYRLLASSGGSLSGNLSANTTSFTQSGLSLNTSYSAFVQTFNISGPSDSSTLLRWTLANPPTGFAITMVASGSVSLAWSSLVNTSYRMERSSNAADWVFISSTAVNASTFTESGLSAQTTVFYRLGSLNGQGALNPIFSNVVSTQTGAFADLTAPTTSLLSITFVASTEIDIAWSSATDNVGVSGYKVFRNSVQIATSTSLGYNDTSLAPLTTYTYTVSAFDAAGNVSGLSNAVSTTTLSLSSGTEVVALLRESCTGYSNCFNTLEDWEDNYGGIDFGTCTVGDLVCANKIAVAQIDGFWTNADTGVVVVNGWTTDAAHYIKIFTASSARASGKWDTTKYRLQGPSNVLPIQTEYVRVDGLQVHADNPESNHPSSINVGGDVEIDQSDIWVSNCLLRGASDYDLTDAGAALYVTSGGSGSILRAWNNILTDYDEGYASGFRTNNADTTVYLYNNTVHNCFYGYRVDNGDVIAKNNIANHTSVGYEGDYSTASTHNLSDQDDAPGSNSKSETSVKFVDSGHQDFRLASTDTGAKDSGVSLSTDSYLAFSTDIRALSRSSGTWDIGALEYTSGGLGALAFKPSAEEEDALLADPSFKLREVFAFPNPARQKSPTIHVACGIADSVELRIYDMAGELLEEVHLDQQPQIINSQYAYEYTWNRSDVASGVYIYVVVAKKSGEQEIRVMKKLAVIK